MNITPSGESLGARIEGIDLSKPLSGADQEKIRQALGRYGVVSFPNQALEPVDLKNFSRRFGTLEINVANAYQESGHPEVMVLSNIVVDGKPLGLADAGQDWHTDMSYSREMAFANVLYGIEIPHRNGEPLGCTEFCNMRAAYLDLPDALKQTLAGRTATHDFNKFWEAMRRDKGSKRPPLTAEQRAKRPPVSQPIFLTHPITGDKVLYCNPGYAELIDGMEKAQSDEILAFLFKHQLQEKYRYRHRWTERDVLMWDNFGTIHNAVADYTPDEHRLIKRCQVMADQVMAGAAAEA